MLRCSQQPTISSQNRRQAIFTRKHTITTHLAFGCAQDAYSTLGCTFAGMHYAKSMRIGTISNTLLSKSYQKYYHICRIISMKSNGMTLHNVCLTSTSRKVVWTHTNLFISGKKAYSLNGKAELYPIGFKWVFVNQLRFNDKGLT